MESYLLCVQKRYKNVYRNAENSGRETDCHNL